MRKISNLLIMAMLAIGMGLTSCDEQLDNAVVPGVTPGTDEGEVTSITVDLSKIDEKYLDTEKTKLQLTVGDEVELSFTILPEEVADTEVELTSADATVLSIDGLKVKALKEGETKVTAKAGGKSATCTVTVSKKAGSISYTTTEISKLVGDAAFTNALTKVGDGTVSYASDNTAVATVATDGTVTIKGAGTATITVTVADSDTYTYATTTASYTLTVSQAVDKLDPFENGGNPLGS